jgi:EpsI family protein
MVTVAFLAWLLAPPLRLEHYNPQLEELIPKHFGDWTAMPQQAGFVDPSQEGEATTDAEKLYDEVLMRSYRNSHGDIIQLALAYGRNQRQEYKIHRPELCYTAQGYQVLSSVPASLAVRDAQGRLIQGGQMDVTSEGQLQRVSYWIRTGALFSVNPWEIRKEIFKSGLSGRVVDGILVRASRTVSATPGGLAAVEVSEEQFLAQLVEAAPAAARVLLVQ